MKTINIIDHSEPTAIPVWKAQPAASTKATGTILPMDLQAAVLRFHEYANGELSRAAGVFADMDEYRQWIDRHDPADEAERLL